MPFASDAAGHGLVAMSASPGSKTTTGADAAAHSSGLPDDVRILESIGTRVHFARNETIYTEGDQACTCYRVVRGAVRLCRHMADGRRQIADFVLAGDLFGFLQLGSYKFTAEAVSDVVLTAYPQKKVQELSSAVPALRGRLLMLTSRRLLAMEDHLVMVGRQTAKERVASFLLLMAGRAKARENELFELPMPRQDIADYLGLTIETVCRVFAELRRGNFIRTSRTTEIAIVSNDRLQKLTE